MPRFNVGDRVQIREWDDMADEFGECGCIRMPGMAFTRPMTYLCGEIFTISDIENRRGYAVYRSEEGVENKEGVNNGYWYLTDSMLIPAGFVLVENYTEAEIDDMLKGTMS